MKKLSYILLTAGVLVFSCDVKKTDSGEAPDVDVEVEADAGEFANESEVKQTFAKWGVDAG